MIPLDLAIALIVAHYVGDFELQTDKMALGKSKSSRVLAQHVGVVSAIYMLFTLPWMIANFDGPFAVQWFSFVAVNFVAHFAIDWCTSRMTSMLWFVKGARLHPLTRAQVEAYAKNNPEMPLGRAVETILMNLDIGGSEVVYTEHRHRFFCTIGMDQMFHYVTLFLTARWLLT